MSGTFYSAGGLRRASWLRPGFNLRLAAVALTLALGVSVVVWIQSSVGRRMARVQQEFGAIEAEGFYIGVTVRTRFRKLNDSLLNAHLKGPAAGRAAFLAESRDLNRWMLSRESSLTTPRERVLFNRLESAYARYLASAEALLQVDDPKAARAGLARTYEDLMALSAPVLEAVGHFVLAQQAAFNVFLRDSQSTLGGLHQLLTLSLVLLLCAILALALFAYRSLIAPLHRRLAESRVLVERHEKLAALGTLAAGVAHEIRNPLTAIKFRLFSLRKSLPPDFAENEDALVISGEINRLDRIVKDFLQFARPSDPDPAAVPARQLLQDVHDLLAPQLEKAGVLLQLEPGASPWIHADTQQIKQVLINLVQNAADSVRIHGIITLSLALERSALPGAASSPAAILSVADTGRGIPPDVQNRLFDPFFTTKEGGTGLGLAIAARIVEKHHGALRYQTQLNRGTTFQIVLPVLENQEPASAPARLRSPALKAASSPRAPAQPPPNPCTES